MFFQDAAEEERLAGIKRLNEGGILDLPTRPPISVPPPHAKCWLNKKCYSFQSKTLNLHPSLAESIMIIYSFPNFMGFQRICFSNTVRLKDDHEKLPRNGEGSVVHLHLIANDMT